MSIVSTAEQLRETFERARLIRYENELATFSLTADSSITADSTYLTADNGVPGSTITSDNLYPTDDSTMVTLDNHPLVYLVGADGAYLVGKDGQNLMSLS